jgi:hypothetical protein
VAVLGLLFHNMGFVLQHACTHVMRQHVSVDIRAFAGPAGNHNVSMSC